MTQYCVSFKFKNTGQVNVGRYDSAFQRGLAIISYSAYADVLDQWEETIEAS